MDYKMLAYLAGFGYYRLNVKSGEIKFDGDYETLVGYKTEDINGPLTELEKYFAPGGFASVMLNIHRHIYRNDDKRNKFEFCAYTADGKEKWLLTISVISERNEDGEPVIIHGVIVDVDTLVKSKEEVQTRLTDSEKVRKSLVTDISKRDEALDNAVKMSELVFNENPYMNILLDEKLKILDCNPTVMELFGFKTKQDMQENLWKKIKAAVPEYQHDGKRTENIIQKAKHILDPDMSEYTFDTTLIIHNSLRYYSVHLKKIKIGTETRIISYMLDTSDIRSVKEQLLYHEALLQGVSDIATILMQFDIYEEEGFAYGIRKALALMCEAVDANCISIWKNFCNDSGELCASRLYGYSRSHSEDYEIGSIEFDYKTVIPEFSGGKYFMFNSRTNEMNEEFQKLDNLYLAKTVLFLPITLQGEFWGFVALAHVDREYFFSENEKKILNTAAMLCGNAVMRYRLNEELRESKTLAENASRAKADFLSRMSHEIRTPMNAIAGMVMLAKKSSDIGEIYGYLGKAEGAASQLLELINNILDMSKIDANKLGLGFAPFSFDIMLDNVLNTIGVRVSEKKQQFILNMQSAVKKNIVSDKLRISQVLLNILGNAVKFTPEGGFITLKIRQKEISSRKCILYFDIIDTGMGIKKENIGKIWAEFEQADGHSAHEYGGTGLGLSITKKIIELLGGEITVRSEYGMGTTFSFYLPLETGDDVVNGDEVNVNTLVISSNKHIREYFKNVLTSYKIPHKVAKDDFEAVNFMCGEKFDVVFLDYDMSSRDSVKKIAEFVPAWNIVVMTGMHSESVIQRFKAIGIRKFMNLPAVPSKVYEIILSGGSKELILSGGAGSGSGISGDLKSGENINRNGKYKGKKIIITEDNEINSMIICDLLEDTGAELYVAENGRQALTLYQATPFKYDIILMDVQMPVMDGLTATGKIRALTFENSNTLPIIAMTANAFNEDRVECLKAGMTDYISKPIDFKLLFEVLDKYLL
jgi:signal transduction histidine kinase/DNA-binding response OmpR family regulator/PAS domain-containing protein